MRILPFIITLIAACSPGKKEHIAEEEGCASTDITYARNFTVTCKNGYKLVEVLQPFSGAEEGFKYLLVPKGAAPPKKEEGVQIIQIPLNSIVCTSTTHIPLLDYLNETESLVGFPTTDYISSEQMRKRIDAGHVTDLGVDNELNIERLLNLDPNAVMAYSLTGDLSQYRKIKQLGIPVIMNAEYLEEHPLGRAEWIKFVALFFDKEALADSLFSGIESEYLQLKSIAAEAESKPEVFSGVVYGDTWFMPGGNNYAAKLLEDAQANYLWSDTRSTGFVEISFEAVYEKAHKADYWIGVGGYETLQSLKNADERYAEFKAYKTGNVYSYNARKGAKGGSEFLELGYLRPDLILADLIKITHPDMLPGRALYFYFKLK